MRILRTSLALAWALSTLVYAGDKKAKNVIVFLGDAGGIPTLHAASVQAFGKPSALYVQRMPNIGLSDTSAVNNWVTDSAAGMTAIVTGQKTNNGVISETAPAAGQTTGTPLKTILEYAEQHGLSTGVVSNSSMADATPAACYAHAPSRKMTGEIFSQVWKPRFGDGVDIVLGPGRKAITAATQALGLNLETELKNKGYFFGAALKDVPAGTKRAVVLTDDADFDITSAANAAIEILSKNPKGFFLMVESDVHTDKIDRGLNRVPVFDRLIESTATRLQSNTLVLFTADHSFDLRTVGVAKGTPLYTVGADGKAVANKGVVIQGKHSGEQVLVAATGPGSAKVKGFLANTDLFQIMLSAFGWKAD
ncbi:alkaline phosphatase [uncultured Paludibaculum sp.]|uniref:alkaline phosphatase n=1 Tax=uncultured Paludibaculum sp. TaxID=1765020 RepID=UPI002AABFD3E|nr:alkaline phosphatase [uncultured Paludibaculum sp.]